MSEQSRRPSIVIVGGVALAVAYLAFDRGASLVTSGRTGSNRSAP